MATPPELIKANAERIARLLGMRLSPKRLPGQARNAVVAALSRHLNGPAATLRAELEEACRFIPCEDERPCALARLLLGGLWLVVPGTPLERGVVEALRRCFHACRHVDRERHAALHEELIACQRSSLPVVRQVAGEVLMSEPIEASEARLLVEDLVPHSIRRRMAWRALQQDQSDFFPAVFGYLAQAIRDRDAGDKTTPQEAAEAVEDLFTVLEHKQGDKVLKPLFQTYLLFAADTAVSGKLMTLLRGYGDPLVVELLRAYRETRSGREPIVRLLAHMAEHGKNVSAAQAMLTLMAEVRGPSLAELIRAFLSAGEGLAQRGPRKVPAALRDVFEEAEDRFAESSELLLRTLAVSLRGLPWDKGLSPEVIRAYLEGRANDSRRWVRSCGDEGFAILRREAEDRQRPVDVRRRAIDILGDLRNGRLQSFASEVVWRIFCEDPDAVVRAAALRAAVACKRDLTDADRQRLIEDLRQGPAVLRGAIEEHREWLFPPSVLGVRSAPPGEEKP